MPFNLTLTPLVADRVQETSATTGTGDISLAGAVTGYRTFASVLTDGQTFYYGITDTAGNWECGLATYHTSGNTFQRSAIFSSSNSNLVVTFLAGGLTCWLDQPAAIVAGGGSVSGYLRGFNLAYLTASTFTVGPPSGPPGVARDKDDQLFFALQAQATINITTNGAINGNDSFLGAGTVAVTTASAAVAGTGTAFLTAFGTRTGTGTMSSVTNVITGVGTRFLSEVAVGDCIGNAANGLYLVTAVNSDTSLTSGVSIGTINFGAFSIIESPTIGVTGTTARQVLVITSNTSLNMVSAAGITASGVTYRIGLPAAVTTAPAGNVDFLYVWMGASSVASGVYCSTQRTTPFGVAGYAVFLRRVGSIRVLSGSTITPFVQYDNGQDRTYQYETLTGTGLLILNGGTASVWTAVSAAGAVPPTARALHLSINYKNSGTNQGYLRARGVGDSATNRPMKMSGLSSATLAAPFNTWIACDGAQAIDYVANSGGNLTLEVIGYRESL